jgi:hypothetical protein
MMHLFQMVQCLLLQEAPVKLASLWLQLRYFQGETDEGVIWYKPILSLIN